MTNTISKPNTTTTTTTTTVKSKQNFKEALSDNLCRDMFDL